MAGELSHVAFEHTTPYNLHDHQQLLYRQGFIISFLDYPIIILFQYYLRVCSYEFLR